MPTRRLSTLGNSPFDAVIPSPSLASRADAQGRGDGAPPSASIEADVKQRLTVHLPADLIDRARNAVYWSPGLTLTGLAEQGIREAVDQVETRHGGPFPSRGQELRGGRPLK